MPPDNLPSMLRMVLTVEHLLPGRFGAGSAIALRNPTRVIVCDAHMQLQPIRRERYVSQPPAPESSAGDNPFYRQRLGLQTL